MNSFSSLLSPNITQIYNHVPWIDKTAGLTYHALVYKRSGQTLFGLARLYYPSILSPRTFEVEMISIQESLLPITPTTMTYDYINSLGIIYGLDNSNGLIVGIINASLPFSAAA